MRTRSVLLQLLLPLGVAITLGLSVVAGTMDARSAGRGSKGNLLSRIEPTACSRLRWSSI